MMEAPKPPLDELIGKALGTYTILQQIGRGGMATVYLAEQSSIGRQVAIKVIPKVFLHDPNFMQRFVHEVKIIAKLQHPRVLPVYDYGEGDGRPYIVMAYLRGGTLAERIKEGPLSLTEAARLIEQIAEGLDYAHSKGVVHRDFKPSNVLLDDQGNAYLADFGIAKLSESSANLTGSGVIGTPAYMAPEMAQGSPATPAVDIYALGVALYEMLTGKSPYSGETPLSVMMAHATKPVPDLRTERPDLPAAVAEVVRKAMSKHPEDRYPTATVMAAALRAAEQGIPLAQATAELSAIPASAPVVPPSTPSLKDEGIIPAPPQKRGCSFGLLSGLSAGAIAVIGCGLLSVGGLGALLLFSTPTPTPTPTIIPPTDVPQAELLPTQADTPDPSQATIEVTNFADYPICALHATNIDVSDSWGENRLPPDDQLDPLETFTIDALSPGTYWLRAEFCETDIYREYLFDEVALAGLTSFWLITPADPTAELTIDNNSGFEVCYLYITRPETETWGGDQLGFDQTIPDGTSVTIRLGDGTWDMRTETCEEDSEERTFWENFEADIVTTYTWTLTN